MEQAGLLRNALYLVRPDGYIAIIDNSRTADALRAYLENMRTP
jgi:hypothetical protein